MTRKMTDAQIEYERKRAAKANQKLDDRLKAKAKATAKPAPAAPKKPGLLKRLIERAHKPI
ncbi:MAG: hypothetical protein ACYCZB_08645 [Acidiphilium sp.]